jgi:hypothetical protein
MLVGLVDWKNNDAGLMFEWSMLKRVIEIPWQGVTSRSCHNPIEFLVTGLCELRLGP